MDAARWIPRDAGNYRGLSARPRRAAAALKSRRSRAQRNHPPRRAQCTPDSTGEATCPAAPRNIHIPPFRASVSSRLGDAGSVRLYNARETATRQLTPCSTIFSLTELVGNIPTSSCVRRKNCAIARTFWRLRWCLWSVAAQLGDLA